MNSRKLWVFRVSGGTPFEIQVKGNPKMKHDGGAESILKTLCTQTQAFDLEMEMKHHGCKVFSHCPMETLEQKAQRENLMRLRDEVRPFPCARCPECAWLDPQLETFCGAGFAFDQPGWEDNVFQTAMKNDRFRLDFEKCPLRE